MFIKYKLLFISIALSISACSTHKKENNGSNLQLCSSEWYTSIDIALKTADSSGHGPDIGSMEWKSVVEFRLGIRGNPNIPHASTEQWCAFIDSIIKKSKK